MKGVILMSNAKKCDICGSFYEIGIHQRYSYGDKPYNTIKLVDEDGDGTVRAYKYINLCSDCKASFEAWLKSKTNTKE